MLIGTKLRLDFSHYSLLALPVVFPSLIVTWAIVAWYARGRWALPLARPTSRPERREDNEATLDKWQTIKGLGIAGALLVSFVLAPIPHDVAALTGAGLLLMSRKLHSTKMLGLVDWELLVLFVGLFVVNHAFQKTALVQTLVAAAALEGIDLAHPATLFAATFVLSNIVSNVPAVMLLLPVATHELAGPLLALVSTLAGNLLIVGSIANIIVVDAAKRQGILIDWRAHARVGIPVTALTLAIAAGWLYLCTTTP
jgi:Na+/H+ antiporter NhaD/arsenite permease-like protein